ncbi:hypothetical protein AMATHDRAFT_2543 [Amanita thiersii Skay4041]|uniref:Uncharacterized protein n=1 Tax=Amanita thiersii Skay4041 TaxID=703135 RepID=A0A2A9NWC7_9AGAR|nr:hypothetical protein AMATHDRAFT_2543 [Amanita thiersii Skay4041]
MQTLLLTRLRPYPRSPLSYLVSRRLHGNLSWCPRESHSFHTVQKRHQRRPNLSFVFDIDGVLLRGPDVLPAAKRALAILEGDNPYGIKIPYLLLTNGGGVSEAVRCEKLTKKLGFPISTKQCIQAHTVLKELSHKYADKPVLVLGGKLDAARRVAEDYGFQRAYTTLDVLAWKSSVWPFRQLSPTERDSTKAIDFSRTRISAVFVFHDPRDWGLDVQIVCDILLSGGFIGGPRVHSSGHVGEDVQLVFCNPDLLWRSDFEQPRLGQGAFKESLLSVYKTLTGSIYPYTQFGKPTKATYDFAGQVMNDWLDELYGPGGPRPQIYMIGDNPASDIAGANAAGWNSILVKTGVYDGKQGEGTHGATFEAEDVEEGVLWALEREMGRNTS